MFPAQTVFILGAGASYEVGFPLGSELRVAISKKLDLQFQHYNDPIGTGDMAIYHALVEIAGSNINDYLGACWQIRDSIVLSKSIDDYVETHKDDKRIAICSKLAIASAIADAEHNSKLYFDRMKERGTIKFDRLELSWYLPFFRLITDNVPKSKMDDVFNNIAIITFNYDRSLEHFLLYALVTHYAISVDESRRLLSSLTIIHAYGEIGTYLFPTANNVDFGERGIRSVVTPLESIRTYTEAIDESDLAEIKNVVHAAETAIFLGSAFHENNMEILQSKKPTNIKRIFATRRGISDSDLKIVTRQLWRLRGRGWDHDKAPSNLYYADDCAGLFNEYSKSLKSQPVTEESEANEAFHQKTRKKI